MSCRNDCAWSHFTLSLIWLLLAAIFCEVDASAQSARTLYTWEGTGDTRGWGGDFGDFSGVTFDNNIAGFLRVSEFLHNGTSYTVVDDANRIDEENLGVGGLDLFGLDALEFDIGMNNSDGSGVNVAFYVQATPNFDFINTPDMLIPDTDNAVNTYTFDLSGLSDAQKAYIRRIGFEVRQHTGDASFRVAEVRSIGAGASMRLIASHEEGTIENGFNGARINFEQAAVAGNDGNPNQSGLSVSNGLLTWTDLGGGPGAAISYQNGQWPWAGNDFESRPHDNTNYKFAQFRIRAMDSPGGGVDEAIDVQGFTQTTDSYTYNALADLSLPVDGEFHDLLFPLGEFASVYTNNISINLQPHDNDVIIDIDSVKYLIPEPSALATVFLGFVCFAVSRRKMD